MKIGSKVICINDNFHPESKKIIPNLPKLNSEYKVRDIIVRFNGNGLLLVEIHNPKVPVGEGEKGYFFEPNFAAIRFKEIEDLSIYDIIEKQDLMLA